MRTSYIWALLLIFWPLQIKTEEFVLTAPASEMRVSRMKIGADKRAYAFSQTDACLYLFTPQGSPQRTIRLNENRESDTKHYFFDFCVGDTGDIYVLSVWRKTTEKIKTGVFIYDSEGKFTRIVTLDKQVDGRRMAVDVKGDLIIAGLTTEFYSGKSDRLFLLHQYRTTGEYITSFGELATSGNQQRPADLYRRLRPLIDRLPLGSCSQGLYYVVPGTNRISFYNQDTLSLSTTIQITPRVGALGQYARAAQEIRELDVSDTEIRAQVAMTYSSDNPSGVTRARQLVITDLQGKIKSSKDIAADTDGILIPSATGRSGSSYWTVARENDRVKLVRH